MEVLPKNKFSQRMEIIIAMVGSAEKLANATGMSAAGIGKYLEGKSDPSRLKLVALANAANVSVGWLATGEGEMRRRESGGHVANGHNNILGAHIDAEDLHLTVHTADPGQGYQPRTNPWLHDWIDTELKDKNISEVMAFAVEFKRVLDAKREG